ncbi:MAG: family 10 glycosylhydrolase, partial [Prevotella sp.]|nr:family 10 glycosylhydrolase [Prevotella sp.]
MLFLGFQNVKANIPVNKREFRGAWIQCINGQFNGMSTSQMQEYLLHQLNELKQSGVNAIIFQVRPECDALYASSIEPWSRFLTGVQGKAPIPYWDPLDWMIKESHKRGMELHAWINPYRAKIKSTRELANNHVAVKYPERVFPYDGQLILNPGLPENREYLYQVVDDIVSRYDIDGLHMDDYFYPYPSPGQTIADDAAFTRYNNGFKNIHDWRRDNVNILIKELGERIHQRKPWVKFGISPFGIYRNKRNDPNIGSETSGLQNYDDLYADVLLWVNNGWIDYNVPQLYWEIGNKAADYKTLIAWWNKYAGKRPLYIGESV